MLLDEKAEKRFWKNVDRRGEDECWEWRRCCTEGGYGQFNLNKRMEIASRVAWTIANGLIPELFEGLPTFICHKCGNPKCCNPGHLFLGNPKINLKDSSIKGRQVYPQLWCKGAKVQRCKPSQVFKDRRSNSRS